MFKLQPFHFSLGRISRRTETPLCGDWLRHVPSAGGEPRRGWQNFIVHWRGVEEGGDARDQCSKDNAEEITGFVLGNHQHPPIDNREQEPLYNNHCPNHWSSPGNKLKLNQLRQSRWYSKDNLISQMFNIKSLLIWCYLFNNCYNDLYATIF